MKGEKLQRLLFLGPIFKDLRRQFDEIQKDIGARQRAMFDLRQQAMQSMPELMKERFHFHEIQQAWLIGGRFGEVAHNAHVRADALAPKGALLIKAGHPRTLRLAGARKEVGIEQTDELGLAFISVDLIDLHVFVVNGVLVAEFES